MSKRIVPTWLGSFYGAALTFLEYEALTIQSIPAQVSRLESELMKSKWFDYRRLHPLQATFYFAECYAIAYGKMLVRAFSHKLGYSRGFKGQSFLESRERLTFWKLRQKVDSVGMRYEFFFNFAIEWHFKRGWLHVPRPAHLLNNDDMFTDCMLAWEDLNKASIQLASDEWYRASNYIGHADQIAYERFLTDQINARRIKKFSLHSLIYRYDALRIEGAIMGVSERDIREAIEYTLQVANQE